MSDTATDTAPNNVLAVEIKEMHKWYGDFHVLKDINPASRP